MKIVFETVEQGVDEHLPFDMELEISEKKNYQINCLSILRLCKYRHNFLLKETSKIAKLLKEQIESTFLAMNRLNVRLVLLMLITCQSQIGF